MSTWFKKRYWAFPGVIILIASVLFVVWCWQRRSQDALCGGGTLNVRAAVGGLDKFLEEPAVKSFTREGPRCLRVTQIQKDPGARATFFYDSNRGVGCKGNDMDPSNGIDGAPLFFFVGHGDSENWYTSGGAVNSNCMELGNGSGGLLRYYWQCSCQAFAHGPSIKEEKSYSDFSQPWNFAGSPLRETPGQSNAFLNWGPVIGDGLRMACGSSTIVPCRYGQIQRIWMNMLSRLGVSVSFIEGLYDGPGSAPLCISRGRAVQGQPLPERSPLSDRAFIEAERGNKDSDFYYIEYPRPLTVQTTANIPAYRSLPVITIEGQPAGVDYQHERVPWYKGWLEHLNSRRSFKSGTQLYEDRSVSLVDLRARCPEDARCKSDGWFLKRAEQFVSRVGWGESDLGPPGGFRLLVDGVKASHGSEVINFQKCVVVRFRRIVVKGNPDIYEDDLDGNIVILINNNGAVAGAWKLWLPTGKVKRRIAFTDANLAHLREVAGAELGKDRGGYEFRDFDFVYRRIGGELVPIVAFHAEPLLGKKLIDFPPKRIDVQLVSQD